MSLSWCDIDLSCLKENAKTFKALLGEGPRLGVVVKSNAYGHGLILAAKAFLEGGADWLIVNAVSEATALRECGILAPILMVGPAWDEEAEAVLRHELRVVAYDKHWIDALGSESEAQNKKAQIHLKIETGNHRQGLLLDEALALAIYMRERWPKLQLEGISTHFSDVEDTTDHEFAKQQMRRFQDAIKAFHAAGFPVPLSHLANSAATLLWPEAHHALVRVGIAAYGHWPSTETYVSALASQKKPPELRPALSWRTKIAQVREVQAGEWIGYGRTFRCTHPSRIAVLPIGYFEGYDRRFSNLSHVLVEGVRAPIRGRICMNMCMVDVTDIPEAKPGSTVTIIGKDGRETVSPELLASLAHTINYEILCRIHPSVERRPISGKQEP